MLILTLTGSFSLKFFFDFYSSCFYVSFEFKKKISNLR